MGGGIGMGNTCKPMAVSFQCMTKFTTNKERKNERKKEKKIKKKRKEPWIMAWISWMGKKKCFPSSRIISKILRQETEL